jgi:putative transposase
MSTVERALSGAEIEVTAKATRRRFTLDYKRKIVQEADRCKTSGAVGALLRREGLYSSHLTTWRAARERGPLAGPQSEPKPHRGAKKHRGVAGDTGEHRALLIAAVTEVGPRLGIAPTCAALGVPRATYYRRRWPQNAPPRRRPSPRALSDAERMAVLAVLHEPRFVDLAPAEVYATLLDEGRYLCSERTMYRVLAEHQEVGERRNQLRHPVYAAPELLARRPNELWSWDITKLLGPAKWTYFYLYVMLDVFSRYVVGWMIAHRESATLAERFIRETCARQGIEDCQLTIHADRGSAMTSKSVAFLLVDLGITKTHSRPHVSNDNPFSEAQFKTLKYRPAFPARFGSIQDARAHCHGFFP